MARDHARLRLDVWSDTDWRALPITSQWLYNFLLSSPKLSYAGVADWRPARIARMARGATAGDIEEYALPLEVPNEDGKVFVVIDRDSEEALIRTFIRHDQIMAVPNVAIACVKAWQEVASEAIRQVIAWEVQHLFADRPEMSAFQDDAASWNWLEEILDYEVTPPGEVYGHLDLNPTDNTSRKPLRGVK